MVSPAALKDRLAAERGGDPFVVLHDEQGEQRIFTLSARSARISVGRSPLADIPVEWDGDASRAHAELVSVGDVWTVVDDGLSRNGTFVNGERVRSRRRLFDRDIVRCGRTHLVFRDPREAQRKATTTAAIATVDARLSEAQRRVLIALARPVAEGDGYAAPASNPEIAAELYLSVPAVKTHMRSLFEKFGVQDLPQNHKRAQVVALATASGIISQHDFAPANSRPAG